LDERIPVYAFAGLPVMVVDKIMLGKYIADISPQFMDLGRVEPDIVKMKNCFFHLEFTLLWVKKI